MLQGQLSATKVCSSWARIQIWKNGEVWRSTILLNNDVLWVVSKFWKLIVTKMRFVGLPCHIFVLGEIRLSYFV